MEVTTKQGGHPKFSRDGLLVFMNYKTPLSVFRFRRYQLISLSVDIDNFN